MLHTPKLDSLRMFDVSARRLNFRLAAQELSLTQSAVAQRVRQLEQELGVALFIRKPRGLALTEAGRHYHSTISQALAMIDEATRGHARPVIKGKAVDRQRDTLLCCQVAGSEVG